MWQLSSQFPPGGSKQGMFAAFPLGCHTADTEELRAPGPILFRTVMTKFMENMREETL